MPQNNSSPLITIITPHFRKIEFTIEAIKSVNKQRGIPKNRVQLIIVDENYNLRTKKALQSLNKNLIYLKTKELEGPGADRQTGLNMTKSKYVMFLDSDDLLNPLFLKESIEALEINKNFQGTVCLSESKFEPGFNLKHKLKLKLLTLWRDFSLLLTVFNRERLFLSSFYLCQLSHMVFRTSALSDFTFNYDYRRGGEDWDLVIHILNKGPIRVLPKRLLKFRYSPGSSTEKPINQKMKWESYALLVSRLKPKFKKGIYYKLFLKYMKIFGQIK